MKKFSLKVLVVLLITTVSCKKDEPPCNCGIIVEDGITDDWNSKIITMFKTHVA